MLDTVDFPGVKTEALAFGNGTAEAKCTPVNTAEAELIPHKVPRKNAEGVTLRIELRGTLLNG